MEGEQAGLDGGAWAGEQLDLGLWSLARGDFEQGTRLLGEGRFAEAEMHLRCSLGLAAANPDALNNLGTAVWHQGRVDEAEWFYRRAAALRPADFAIQNNLGNVLWRQGRLEEAIPHYEQAIKLNPDSAEVRMNLGVILADLGRADEAVAWIGKALEIRPDWPDALDNLGVAHARAGRWDLALDCHERALELDPHHADAHRNRAFVWLKKGDFLHGWPEYEWRLQTASFQGFRSPIQAWDGSPLTNGTLLLHAEQGLGDAIQFSRYIELVRPRVGQLFLLCPRAFVRLAERLDQIDGVITGGEPLPAFDRHASLLSLPAIVRTTLDTIPASVPYLKVDDPTRVYWRERLDAVCPPGGQTRLRIGVCWQGNPRNRTDRRRSFPLSALEPLSRVDGVRLVVLQREHGLDQLAGLAKTMNLALLEPVESDSRDLLDTAAIMQALDLVISPDSMACHLAGALAVPVWVAMTRHTEWRWLEGRDDCPWYPTMRLFHQTTPGSWPSVFKRMADSLAEKLP